MYENNGSCMRICNISGTTITKGNLTYTGVLDDGGIISACKLQENKIIFAQSNNNQIALKIYTISGNSLNYVMQTKITTSGISYDLQVLKLTESKIILVYTNNSNKKIYGIVCTINSTNIQVGNSTDLASGSYPLSLGFINENRIIIIYRQPSNTLRQMVCKIENTIITVDIDSEITDKNSKDVINSTSTVILNNNTGLVIFSSSETKKLNGIFLIYTFENLVKKITLQSEEINRRSNNLTE